MYDYTERIDPIWRYTEFIANHVGHKGVKCVHGTLDEEIEAIRVHIRELFDHFAVSEEEDRLGTYANISLELRKSFFI